MKEKIDLGIISVPKKFVLDVLQECGEKKIKNVIIISAGFGESGDKETDKKLKEIIKKYKIKLLGPNVVGVYNGNNKLDATFLPKDAFERPKKGKISILSQSGTIGAVFLERFFNAGLGISKFISYGNALDINEVDILEYFEKDKETDIICMYVEEVKNGKRFIDFLKNHKKPLIILKAGKSKKAKDAVMSHTGSMAGDSRIYSGIFKQYNVIQAEGINDFINYSKALIVRPFKEVFIITNGGGYGILITDWFEKLGIKLYDLKEKAKQNLKKQINKVGMSYSNPFDLLGDADISQYKKVLEIMKKHKDLLFVVILLGQSSVISKIAIKEFIENIKKLKLNCVFLNTDKSQEEYLIEQGYPSYILPENLAKAIKIRIKK